MKRTSPSFLVVLCALTCIGTERPAFAASSFSSSPGLGYAPYVSGDRDPEAPKSADIFFDAIKKSTPFLEMRYRYEYVDQSNLFREAHAHTLRTIGGFQTDPYNDFRLALGFENVMPLGSNNTYNDGVNNLSAYPKIGDPRDTQLQLANLQWRGLPDTSVTAGRQHLAIDNQRWIGNSNWRQVRQSFDAVTVKNGSVPDVEFFYSYVFNTSRSAGARSSLGSYEMNTNLFHAVYTGVPDLKVSAYAYLMDIGGYSTLSNKTFGARAEIKHPFSDTLALTGAAEYARQSNYANNPSSYSLDYFTAEPGVILGQNKGRFGSLTGKGGYELLGGNGSQGLRTPLASQHSQNGWAEMFSTVPRAGLQDVYLSAAYRYQLPWDVLAPTKFQTDWHRFSSDEGSIHYGNEIDVGISQVIDDHYTLELQYANYHKDNDLNPNTNKLMLIGLLQY